MPTPNFVNRTIWTGDNLDILRGLNSESVHLIYLDPPFNSNRNYSAPVGSLAAGAAFKDAWTLDDVDEAQHGLIAEVEPALYEAIHAAGIVHGKSMKSYLIMMAVRLLEMRRVLKDTGSIYLHCDPTASHYLKLVMDAVFGVSEFWAEIKWKRTSTHNDRLFGSQTDTILMYGGDKQNWDAVRVPLDEKNIKSKYRYHDRYGQYRTGDLTGAGTREGESGAAWRGFDPTAIGRHWAVPKSSKYARYLDEVLLPGYRSIEGNHDRLDALAEAGMIHYSSRTGGMPSLKRYLRPDAGQLPGDLWIDIEVVNSQAKERTGYPTQKPIALLERIIKASSNPGDVVLDPFCGCATACIAAENLDRQWAGIDLSERAYTLVRQRLANEVGVGSAEHPRLTGWNVMHRTDIPRRDDLAKLPNYRTHKHTLYGRQEGICNGCNVLFPFRNMTVDHIVPRARGGSDDLSNLQLLCGACNSMKGQDSHAAFLARLKREGIAPSLSG